MSEYIVEFLRDEGGQDLIEYTLLMAFVSLSCVIIFSNAGGSVDNVWKDASKTLTNASVAAAS